VLGPNWPDSGNGIYGQMTPAFHSSLRRQLMPKQHWMCRAQSSGLLVFKVHFNQRLPLSQQNVAQKSLDG